MPQRSALPGFLVPSGCSRRCDLLPRRGMARTALWSTLENSGPPRADVALVTSAD